MRGRWDQIRRANVQNLHAFQETVARLEQARKLMKSIMAGDPDAREVIKQGFKGKIEEFLHR